MFFFFRFDTGSTDILISYFILKFGFGFGFVFVLPLFLGNVIYFEVFGRPFVVLNALEDAKALLEKQSIIYSDRPRMVYIPEMCVLLSPLLAPPPHAF